jgi:LmbE family N-acetylglucosaminyl deacetylase
MAQTLVCFHAHPDDEALLTAGVMAAAAAAGHRVVLVVATRGEVGMVADDFLAEGETLADRRWHELARSALELGVRRLEWLGYGDSGSGDPVGGTEVIGDRTDPEESGPAQPFALADVEAAAEQLAEILKEEHADVLTTYDPNGGYGHPDHVQVHRVGRRAGELAATPIVLEATINRDLIRMGADLADSLGVELPPQFNPSSFDHWYTSADELTHAVDVRAQLPAKRASMEAHGSQATSADPGATRSFESFLSLPPDYFELAFGTEFFVDRGRPPGIAATDIFEPRPS